MSFNILLLGVFTVLNILIFANQVAYITLQFRKPTPLSLTRITTTQPLGV
jgi:hypothetical protein